MSLFCIEIRIGALSGNLNTHTHTHTTHTHTHTYTHTHTHTHIYIYTHTHTQPHFREQSNHEIKWYKHDINRETSKSTCIRNTQKTWNLAEYRWKRKQSIEKSQRKGKKILKMHSLGEKTTHTHHKMNRYRKFKTKLITKFTVHLVHSLNLSDQDVTIVSGKSVHAGSKLGIWCPVSQKLVNLKVIYSKLKVALYESCFSCEIFVKNAFFSSSSF